jgi:ribonuclease-3
MELESILGYTFKKTVLLEEALTHPSKNKTLQKRPFSYQRLEFLGDAVLGLVIAEMLYEAFPTENEGNLAKRLAGLVRSETLALVGKKLGIEQFIYMANSEEQSGGRTNQSNIEDVCESLIGAMYLDGGLEPARSFIRTHWAELLEAQPLPPKDAKTALQEWAQGRGKPLPEYKVVSEIGPSHAPEFTIEVHVQGLEPMSATGNSKRAAEQKAAQAMLEKLDV